MIAELLSNLLGAISNGYKWATGRSELKNAPEIKANATKAEDAKTLDADRKVVAEGDADEIRKRLS